MFSPPACRLRLDVFRGALPTGVDLELDQFTPWGREVLRHIACGLTSKEIAARLHLSVKTVETHVSAVFCELQLPSRHELTHWAMTAGWSDPAIAAEPTAAGRPVRSKHKGVLSRRLTAGGPCSPTLPAAMRRAGSGDRRRVTGLLGYPSRSRAPGRRALGARRRGSSQGATPGNNLSEVPKP